jgi:hypothetical protein
MAARRKSTPPRASQPVDFEKLGVFYLGRRYDLDAGRPGDGLLLYDAKDLVTHAVCIGMTGSGKTGLCLSLLEEAALDGIPAIAIDPKGDLPDLLLTFPELRPEDFAPWIDEDDARRRGVPPDEYAAQQATRWREGLAAWGQDGGRIRRLREAAEFVVYTPGSTAGVPVSILRSFAAPPSGIRDDPELLRERVSTTATSLLGLLGLAADPLKSREHILVSTVLDAAWRAGRDLDLAGLIRDIQFPSVARVGVLDLEAFYPSKERFELAMALNNLLAAPGFGAWLEGEALDVGEILRTPHGKPRVAIFSIAHLADAERMFFVSLLLNQVLGWMRTQSGTSSLRAIVYMDEIFGYFPPVANPPSKLPLLTLLKQARAFGVGIVLATQNPVDLDYKGLANTGTWFIGRLQTERDKARVLDGLEGASAAAGGRLDRGQMERILGRLGNRVFLVNNVHEDAPEVFETRWAMSYLRGPLTRTQIKTLMEPTKAALTVAAPPPSAPVPAAAAPPGARPPGAAMPAAGSRPVLPPEVPERFLPVRRPQPQGATLEYRPMLLGAGEVRISDARRGVDTTEEVARLAAIGDGGIPVGWDSAGESALDPADLEDRPVEGAAFGSLPPATTRAKSYETWRKEFADWLYRHRTLDLLRSPSTGMVSRRGESERDFRIRLEEAARVERDEAKERLRQKYAPKVRSLEERLRRAQQTVERESEQVTQQGLQTAISVAATLLGAFLGRKTVSASTVGRATTAARGAGRVFKERQDVGRARETEASLQQQLADLAAQFEAEVQALDAGAPGEALETVTLRPTRQNVSVKLLTLAWAPSWRDVTGTLTPAWG